MSKLQEKEDLSKEKKRDEALRESEELYKALLRTSPDAVTVTNLKGKIIDVSERAIELSSAKNRDDLIGRSSFELLAPEEQEKAFINLQKTLKDGYLRNVEYKFLRLDGSSYIGELNVGIVRDPEGNPKAFIVTVREITDRKNAEEALIESAKRYRLTLNSLGDAIHVVDEDLRITLINLAFTQWLQELGIDSKCVGKTIFECFPFLPDRIRAEYEIVFDQGTTLLTEETTVINEKKFITETRKIPIIVEGKVNQIITSIRNITARKRVEQALKESEEKYRTVVERSLQGIGIIQDFIIVFANNALSEILGYTIRELYSLSFEKVINLIYDEDREFVINRHKDRLEGKDIPSHYTFRVVRKDGQVRWVEIYATLIKYKGKPAVQKVIIDITEKKETGEKLKESEEKYRLISENANDIIVILNNKFIIEYINEETAFRLFGYKKEEMLGKRAREFGHPDEFSRFDIAVPNAVRKGEGMGEIRFKHKEGFWLWLDIKGKVFKDAQGKMKILLIGRDITERKKVEEQMRESEEKFRTITEQSLMGITIVQDNLIKYVNKRFSKMAGYPVKELKAWPPGELMKVIYPKDIEIVKEQLFKKQRGDEDIIPHYPVRIITKRGEKKWIDVYSKSINYGGRPADLVTAIDITEKMEAENLRKEQLNKLTILDKIRKDLISRVSHEIKTPLMAISGAVELLLDMYRNELDEDALELVRMIERSDKRLQDLVSNLIDISRIEYDKLELEKQLFNLCDIIRECSNDMRPLLNKRKVNLKLQIPEKLEAEIDVLRIAQVINNLLSNAIKNTAADGNITISLEQDNDSVVIIVKDNGVGLTVDEIRRLFTRFGKIERYEQGLEFIDIQGSGLGLFISKEIVNLHDGEIWAESEGRHKGATFKVKLPLK